MEITALLILSIAGFLWLYAWIEGLFMRDFGLWEDPHEMDAYYAYVEQEYQKHLSFTAELREKLFKKLDDVDIIRRMSQK